MTIKTIARASAVCLAMIAPPASSQDAARIEQGREILQQKCAKCHATASTGPSPMQEAPPFRDLHLKYDVGHLAEALAEGIVSGHPAMPEFIFPPAEIDAIIGYIQSLSGP